MGHYCTQTGIDHLYPDAWGRFCLLQIVPSGNAVPTICFMDQRREKLDVHHKSPNALH